MTEPGPRSGDSSVQPIQVAHLVDAMGGTDRLWGKERMVLWLMQAQRAIGNVDAHLITFAPGALADLARQEGFPVTVLADVARTLPIRAVGALRRRLRDLPGILVHTHGYKANLVGRWLRRVTGPIDCLVSTMHGWVETSWRLRLYNELDRRTSRWSDEIVVPDGNMLARVPKGREILNGIPDRLPPTAQERQQARARFGWRDQDFVVGMLGRLSIEKGVLEYVDAAGRCTDQSIVWAVAGSGPLLEEALATAPASVRHVGYIDPADDYLASLDAFIQPSRTEALSLSLLEAARAALPIIATRVGATASAVRPDREALLIPPQMPDQLAEAVARLRADPGLASRLAAAARQRFTQALQIHVACGAYAQAYREVIHRNRGHKGPHIS